MKQMENNNETTHEVKIDKQSIIQQIADKAITELLTAFVPDNQGKKLIAGLMNIHRKYGIDALTSVKIITDMGELLKEESND